MVAKRAAQIGACRLRHRPFRRGAKFPVIPVEPGIFSVVSEKSGFGIENSDANQSLAGQFPLPAKREFIRG